MLMKPYLLEADALLICKVARAHAVANSWAVTIAVVDEAGALMCLQRMDGTGVMSSEIATGKARMAALSRRPSAYWEDRISTRPVFLKFSHGLPIQGGVPIVYQSWCVGGVGVSGVQSHEDEAVAQAGIDGLVQQLENAVPDNS